jgi:exosortase K
MKKAATYSFVFLVGFALLFKTFYSLATNDMLQFVLLPTSQLVSLFLHKSFVYSLETGFYFPALQITINKYCAGLNFFLITLLSTFLTLEISYQTFKQKLVLFLCLCLLTYLLTIFANVSRILIAIRSRYLPFEWVETTWFHEAQGTFVYLSLLLLAYTSLVILHKKYTR